MAENTIHNHIENTQTTGKRIKNGYAERGRGEKNTTTKERTRNGVRNSHHLDSAEKIDRIRGEIPGILSMFETGIEVARIADCIVFAGLWVRRHGGRVALSRAISWNYLTRKFLT